MEQAVSQRVSLQAKDRVDGLLVADEVMPLQDLMEHYPVDQTAHAQPQQRCRQHHARRHA